MQPSYWVIGKPLSIDFSSMFLFLFYLTGDYLLYDFHNSNVKLKIR